MHLPNVLQVWMVLETFLCLNGTVCVPFFSPDSLSEKEHHCYRSVIQAFLLSVKYTIRIC